MGRDRIQVLLVEDDPNDAWVTRGLLGNDGRGSFELVQVESLAAAIERCNQQRFDVLLLDLNLPDSKGLATFFAAYAYAEDVPIVILADRRDEAVAVKAVQAGAQDYLLKGHVNDLLLARSIRYAIERGRRHRAEESMRDTSEEFRAAQQIQRHLYPAGPPTLPGFEIAGMLYPAKATAGDYFDYIPMLDDCLGVVVGDVSSHGMGPALLMAETRACLRTLVQTHSDVGEILTRANRLLTADTSDFHFITLAMARLDPRDRSMVYASAGQRGYLLHADADATILDSTSLPLGVHVDTVVPAAAAIALRPGDLVTFFTDGVAEAESPGGVRFGIARALQVMGAACQRPAREIVEALHQEVLGFCRNRPPLDDVTIVVVKVMEG